MKCRMLPALIAALSVSSLALAGGDSSSPAAKPAPPSPAVTKPAPQVEVKVLQFGKVIQVERMEGPDQGVQRRSPPGNPGETSQGRAGQRVQDPRRRPSPASGAPKALFTASTSGKLKVVVMHDGKSQEIEFDLGGSRDSRRQCRAAQARCSEPRAATLPDDAKHPADRV